MVITSMRTSSSTINRNIMISIIIRTSTKYGSKYGFIFSGGDSTTREYCRSRVPLLNPIITSTKILDFGGFDSSTISKLRGGIPRPVGKFPESLRQAILAGIILLGRLGVDPSVA